MDFEANLPSLRDPRIKQQKQKRCSKYSMRALGFALTTFVAYLGSASSSSGNIFKVAMTACIIAIAIDLFSATKKTPITKWGNVWVYISWFLLVLVSYLLLVAFNKSYAYAILPAPLPIAIAFLHRKLLDSILWPRIFRRLLRPPVVELPTTINSRGSVADHELDSIFELSAVIVNGGGVINVILGHYMAPNQDAGLVGYLFFFTVALGLYLMMVTTVRKAVLTRHATCLAYVLMALILGILIAIAINAFSRQENATYMHLFTGN